jgi:hypothetical protein
VDYCLTCWNIEDCSALILYSFPCGRGFWCIPHLNFIRCYLNHICTLKFLNCLAYQRKQLWAVVVLKICCSFVQVEYKAIFRSTSIVWLRARPLSIANQFVDATPPELALAPFVSSWRPILARRNQLVCFYGSFFNKVSNLNARARNQFA